MPIALCNALQLRSNLQSTPIVSPTLGYFFSPSPALHQTIKSTGRQLFLCRLIASPLTTIDNAGDQIDANNYLSANRTTTIGIETAIKLTPLTVVYTQTNGATVTLSSLTSTFKPPNLRLPSAQQRSRHNQFLRRPFLQSISPATQGNLNAVFSRILPNISSLFIVDDDGVETLRQDLIPILKSLIVATPPLHVVSTPNTMLRIYAPAYQYISTSSFGYTIRYTILRVNSLSQTPSPPPPIALWTIVSPTHFRICLSPTVCRLHLQLLLAPLFYDDVP
eukprot:jgi/Psemu1/21922/gm1.21922_g